MSEAATRVEVGVRELKNNLSRYLVRVRGGDEVVVTDHGRPVARLVAIDASTDRLAALIDDGTVRAARSPRRALPQRVRGKGTVSDLVADQRR
jgi:prevent-host-death family protein